MMTAEALMAAIEEDVPFDLGLASGVFTMRLRAEANETLQAAAKELAERDDLLFPLLKRAKEIYATPGPEGYAHPKDLALAAYLWLLSGARRYGSLTKTVSIARRVYSRLIDRFLYQVYADNRPEFFSSAALAERLHLVHSVTSE